MPECGKVNVLMLLLTVPCHKMRIHHRRLVISAFAMAIVALPEVHSKPATSVIWEGQAHVCHLNNGTVRQKGEGPCSEYLGVCIHDNGSKVSCSSCTPYGNCRPLSKK